ncbi:acyltransferase [Phenylobacterium sp. J367]|uniref:acyltransferase family protein n=1 Tax=Phenylobacterium sp. J367 TaxID=2898435 RepID=UPI00215152E1|nr:acyltransferase [Phenylobacterium sp. J367]MCR5877749.1 acyltransferase [Phenylobacterium sp. J367]
MEHAPQRNTVVGIQYLRAIAALLVLVHHARNPRPWLFNPLKGWDFTAGVEIFFVISGVIMLVAARDERPADFMRRRMIRVVPLYWIATLTWLAWLAWRDLDLPTTRDLLLSLGMIPHEGSLHPGIVWPVLVPGWTLNFEMFFYALFAVGLAFRRVMAVVPAALLLLVGAGYAFSPDDPILKTYTSPLLLGFLGGLGVVWLRERSPAFARAWPLALVGGGLLCVHFSPWFSLPKVAVIGAATLLVAGVMALEPLIARRPSKPLLALGDASYAIYLFHTLVLAVVAWRCRTMDLEAWPQFLTVVGLGIGLSVAAGLAVHYWIEKPMLKGLLKLGRRRGRPPGITSAEPAPSRAS